MEGTNIALIRFGHVPRMENQRYAKSNVRYLKSMGRRPVKRWTKDAEEETETWK